ncbi:MAG: hypothetical protein LUD55_06830 [Oscillospiraceae bacterium]|nr:hypothetical protein [Oscillospiraceae bacterium]
MAKKLSKLQLAQQEAEIIVKKANAKITELGAHGAELDTSLDTIQLLFNRIRNMPEENVQRYRNQENIRIKWKQQAREIELEYKKAEVQVAGQGAAGVSAGFAVAALGPTAAMGIATTFGVASTGTAISALSGAAATNAALAWLGGGALAAGGGGMAAGSAFLALAGPVGWAIAGLSILSSGLFFLKTRGDKERLENIFVHISKRDIKSYRLAIVELNERIKRIIDENQILSKAITQIETFGTEYDRMSEAQQYELGSYVNLMESSTALLVNPILGLLPKYTEQDYEKLCASDIAASEQYFVHHKDMVIALANLLYKITLDDKDKKLLAKSLKKNKEFLSTINLSRKEFDSSDISMVEIALNYRYENTASAPRAVTAIASAKKCCQC